MGIISAGDPVSRLRKGSGASRGMDGPERLEAKAEDKGESEEASAGIEADRRRKEIADNNGLD